MLLFSSPASVLLPMKIYLVASGDSRLSANQKCWPAQLEMETQLSDLIAGMGHELVRAHAYDPVEQHGFLCSQRQGMDVFASMDPDIPVIVAESVWQYSHHVLPGLSTHRGPILTLANWSGTWPGLVGMLNLNGSLTKANISYSTLWAEDFRSEDFRSALQAWLQDGTYEHQTPHVSPFLPDRVEPELASVAARLAEELIRRKAIMGVFDEGCMGMYNAIIPDELLHVTGVFKERLSQSALLAAMEQVSDAEAGQVVAWLESRKFQFCYGSNPDEDLTPDQVLNQAKMYVAVCRMADEFDCDAVGIQYQQGLKDMCCASDLVEGLLNDSIRPPVRNAKGEVIRDGRAILHFNEVDECAGLDALLIERVHRALQQPVETTLHDLRWGDWDSSGTVQDYVWVFEISGAAPASHHIGGYAGSTGERQPAMYFPKGGSTLKGIARPGEIVWSRIFIAQGKLHLDIGRARVVELPERETQRRWDATTSQWPIMHAVLHGVSRDQMMARHKSNHIQVVYATDADAADRCLRARASLAHQLGIQVHLCGVTL